MESELLKDSVKELVKELRVSKGLKGVKEFGHK